MFDTDFAPHSEFLTFSGFVLCGRFFSGTPSLSSTQSICKIPPHPESQASIESTSREAISLNGRVRNEALHLEGIQDHTSGWFSAGRFAGVGTVIAGSFSANRYGNNHRNSARPTCSHSTGGSYYHQSGYRYLAQGIYLTRCATLRRRSLFLGQGPQLRLRQSRLDPCPDGDRKKLAHRVN